MLACCLESDDDNLNESGEVFLFLIVSCSRSSTRRLSVHIWSTPSPCGRLKKYINMLENVQIRATKLVDGLGSLDYPERLRKLQLPTLAYRRARGDMIEVYEHIHTYDRAILSRHFQLQPRGSRKHDFQLVWNMPKDSTRELQANSFCYRTTRI